MKNSVSLLRQFIVPLLLLLISVSVFLMLPLQNHLSPRALTTSSDFEAACNEDNPHVAVEASGLQYTGYDSLKNGHSYGSYYYTLINGRCQFYLLKTDRQEIPPPVVDEIAFKGLLTPMELSDYDSLTAKLAESIDWTVEGVRSISPPYLVSAQDFFHWKQILLTAVLSLCILVPSLDILITLFTHKESRKRDSPPAAGH